MTYWVWVFGEIDGLRWVLREKRMAFAEHVRTRARRIQAGDRAVLYVSRGAHHNPTRDRSRLRGLVTVTSDCQDGKAVRIANRDFTMTCEIKPELLHPERSGPEVRELVEDLDVVRRTDVWGQYFRNSPIEVSSEDFSRLAQAVRNWDSTVSRS